jgi:lysophospholipase L1-like esterase
MELGDELMEHVVRYLAIGDSLTVGFGSFLGPGFVEQYRFLAQQYFRKPIMLEKAARIGATTGDILQLLHGNSRIQSLIRQADIITITAGGNDLIRAAKLFQSSGNVEHFMSALRKCQENVRHIVYMIHQLKIGQSNRYIVRMADLYNPYPQIKEGVFWVKQFNKHLRGFEGSNLRVADIYHAFLGRENELLFLDHIHPNTHGYRVIAEQMNRLGY